MPIGVRCGIPVELFYKLNPKKLKRWQAYFNEALIASENDLSKAGWVHGYYVRAAIGSSFSKKFKYPEDPYFQKPRTEPSEDEHVFTDADNFMAFAAAFNKSRNVSVVDALPNIETQSAEST